MVIAHILENQSYQTDAQLVYISKHNTLTNGPSFTEW